MQEEEEDKPINNNKQQRKSSNNNNNGGHEAQMCPRCDSANTKFCYYNNYSLSQPRYFCKSCRRYWTHGGTLRNVPVGGGSRKGKRPKTAPPPPPPPPPLAFPPAVAGSQLAYLPSFAAIQPHEHLLSGPSAMSLLQGFADASPASSSFGQFYTNPNNYYPSGTSSEAAAWNIGAASNAGASGSSLAPPNQWPDIPGPYGSPPP